MSLASSPPTVSWASASSRPGFSVARSVRGHSQHSAVNPLHRVSQRDMNEVLLTTEVSSDVTPGLVNEYETELEVMSEVRAYFDISHKVRDFCLYT